MYPAAPRDFRRPVAAAIVHYQVFDLIHADDLPRQCGDGRRQILRLIEARNLDDQFHGISDGFSAFSRRALSRSEAISFADPTYRLSIWLERANDNVAPAHRPQKHLLRCALVPDRSHQLRRPALEIHRKRVQHPDAPPLTTDRLEL